jgi:hypothetical protein
VLFVAMVLCSLVIKICESQRHAMPITIRARRHCGPENSFIGAGISACAAARMRHLACTARQAVKDLDATAEVLSVAFGWLDAVQVANDLPQLAPPLNDGVAASQGPRGHQHVKGRKPTMGRPWSIRF